MFLPDVPTKILDEHLTNHLRRKTIPRLGEAVESCVKSVVLGRAIRMTQVVLSIRVGELDESRLPKASTVAGVRVDYVHGPCGCSMELLFACIEAWGRVMIVPNVSSRATVKVLPLGADVWLLSCRESSRARESIRTINLTEFAERLGSTVIWTLVSRCGHRQWP